MKSDLKQQFISFAHFLFCLLFTLWLVLAFCELIMPGFAIYYINLNYLFVAVCLLALVDVIIGCVGTRRVI